MPKFRKQPLDIPLVQGLSQQTDDRMQSPGGMAVADNVYFEKDARLVKRPGFTQRQMFASPGSGLSLFQKAVEWRDRAVFTDSRDLFERGPDLDVLIRRGPIPNIAAPDREVISHDVVGSVAYAAMAILDRYRVYAWLIEDATLSFTGELWTAVYALDRTDNIHNGALLFRERIVATDAWFPRLFATDTHFVLMWLEGSGDPKDLNVTRLPVSSLPTAWDAPVTLTTCTDDMRYDACPSGTHIFLAHQTAAAAFKLRRIDSSLAFTHTQTIAEDCSQGLGIGAGTTLAVGWINATNVRAGIYATADLSNIVAAGSLLSVGSTTGTISWVEQDSNTWVYIAGLAAVTAELGLILMNQTYSGTIQITPLTTVQSRPLWHLTPAAKPFLFDDRLYCPMLFDTGQLQQSFVVCELPLNGAGADGGYLRPVCSLANNGTAQFSAIAGGLAQLNDTVTTAVAGSWAVALPEFFAFPRSLTNSAGVPIAVIGTAGVTTWDFSAFDEQNTLFAELGGALYLSGGVASQYDGDVVHEVGFVYPPQFAKITETAGAATYVYTFTYIWQDKFGQLHESAPGQPRTIENAALPIDVRVMTQSCSQKHQPDTERGTFIAVRIYRTQDSDPIFWWVADLQNDKNAVATAIYTDSRIDSDIAGGFPLYTDGGILPSSQPVSAKTIAVWDNRLFVSQGNGVLHTKQWSADRAVSFVASATHTIDTRDADDVTGLSSLDDALLIGKSGRLYAVAGSGPTNSGQNPYAPPRAWNTENGIIEPRSLLIGSPGVYFRGDQGMYLAPRGFGEIQWLGRFARDVLDAFPVVASATLVPEKDLAIWAVHTDAKTDGVLLVLDYERNIWTTWTLPTDPVVTGICLAPLESGGEIVRSLQMTCASSDEATLWADEGGIFDIDSDNTLLGGHVTSRIETQFIAPSSKVNGYSRAYSVRLRGELLDAEGCKLTLEAKVDDDSAWRYGVTWIIKGPVGMKFEREWVLPWPNLEVVKLRVTDEAYTLAEVGPDGALVPSKGFAWNALTLDVAVRGGQQKPLQEAHRG